MKFRKIMQRRLGDLKKVSGVKKKSLKSKNFRDHLCIEVVLQGRGSRSNTSRHSCLKERRSVEVEAGWLSQGKLLSHKVKNSHCLTSLQNWKVEVCVLQHQPGCEEARFLPQEGKRGVNRWDYQEALCAAPPWPSQGWHCTPAWGTTHLSWNLKEGEIR